MAYFISRIIFKVLLHILHRFKVTGREKLPARGPFIVASNHASLLDPAVVGVACNSVKLVFMAKKELFGMPVMGRWVRSMGCIPTERYSKRAEPLKEALRKLREGRSIVIFPEGTRSPDGELQKAEPGIGFLAVKSKTPIVPFYVYGTAKALPKGEKRMRRSKITVKIGNIVDISELTGLPEKRKAYDAIGEKVMEAIARLKNE